MTMLPFRGRCHTCGHDHDSETQHWRDVLDLATRADGMPASGNERYLRRLLAARVAMPHTYYDDGEMQGQEHGISIDFMREPVADIDAKLRALNVARAEQVSGDRYFAVEFEVWQEDEMCASASGTREDALREAMHYATQYGQGGPVRVFEVTRTLVTPNVALSRIQRREKE